jgi:hypothetical protein
MVLFSDYRLLYSSGKHIQNIGNVFLSENSPMNSRTKPPRMLMVFKASEILQIVQSAILPVLILVIYLMSFRAFASECSHHKNMNKIALPHAGLVEGYLEVLSLEWVGLENDAGFFSMALAPAHNSSQITDPVKSFVTNNRFPNLFRHCYAPEISSESILIMAILNDSSRGEYSL